MSQDTSIGSGPAGTVGDRDPTDMPVMIHLDGVEKIYAPGEPPAVERLTLDVHTGEILVLVGPSGCGKSTTLRLINRMIEPTGGRIIFDGEDVTEMDPTQLRRRIGYVIQRIGLFPHQTIAENIGTVPRLLGWDANRATARTDELLDLVGLEPSIYRDRYPKELSGGQAQRVGVARALAADPPVMLMDEPFGAVDPITRDRLQNEFLRLQAEVQKTIVFVTHDIDEAIKMGDRIAILRERSVVAQLDTPARILSYPVDEFVDDFIGAGSTLKGLHFERVEGLDVPDYPTVTLETSRSEARQLLADSDFHWLLALDAQNRPARWIKDDHLSGSSQPLDQVGLQVRAVVEPNATLHDALEAMITSSAAQAVVIDHDGTYRGVVQIELLTEAIRRMRSDARRHYEQLEATR
ncbi:MAG: ABC transporter ATP-binding protein [Nitriliruptoraceae bacterium]